MSSGTHYLDHAATTPMVSAAIDAMAQHLREVGNPGAQLATVNVRATVDPLTAWFGDPTRQLRPAV